MREDKIEVYYLQLAQLIEIKQETKAKERRSVLN